MFSIFLDQFKREQLAIHCTQLSIIYVRCNYKNYMIKLKICNYFYTFIHTRLPKFQIGKIHDEVHPGNVSVLHLYIF